VLVCFVVVILVLGSGATVRIRRKNHWRLRMDTRVGTDQARSSLLLLLFSDDWRSAFAVTIAVIMTITTNGAIGLDSSNSIALRFSEESFRLGNAIIIITIFLVILICESVRQQRRVAWDAGGR